MNEVEICSAALAYLGKPGITALDEDTTLGRACTAMYALARDKVLEDRVWSFALKQLQLTPLAAAPLFKWTYQYELPVEVVRVVRVDNGDDDYRMAWELQGRRILANDAAINVTATVRTADPGIFSPGFCTALALRLASMLAVPLTGNRQHLSDLFSMYQKEIKEASGADGAQGRSETLRSDSLSIRR